VLPAATPRTVPLQLTVWLRREILAAVRADANIVSATDNPEPGLSCVAFHRVAHSLGTLSGTHVLAVNAFGITQMFATQQAFAVHTEPFLAPHITV